LLWDLDRPAEPDTLLSPGQSATAITFSPDGRRVAIGSNDQLVYIADTARHSVILRLHGHIARVSGVRFTPDGRTLISCSLDGTVRAWKAE
jgi:WD40 repeat protein